MSDTTTRSWRTHMRRIGRITFTPVVVLEVNGHTIGIGDRAARRGEDAWIDGNYNERHHQVRVDVTDLLDALADAVHKPQ